MPGLEDLYREIILDHYRSPRNHGELPAPPAHRTEGLNPLCGDEIVLPSPVGRRRTMEGVGGVAAGAAGGAAEPVDVRSLGELAARQGVVKFPVRIKCATLAWNTLDQALHELESEPAALEG